jgi:hypothetical protein
MGQDARLTFNGTSGQRVSLEVTSVTNPSAYVYLVPPTGSAQYLLNITSSCVPCFVDTQTLNATGVFTLWIQHSYTYVGSETLQLYNVVDASASTTIGGAAVPVTTTVPGQNANVTFGGTTGQNININFTAGTYGQCNATLYNPDTTIQGTYYGACQSTPNSINGVALSQTGTYKIFLDPQGTITGTVTTQVTLH